MSRHTSHAPTTATTNNGHADTHAPALPGATLISNHTRTLYVGACAKCNGTADPTITRATAPHAPSTQRRTNLARAKNRAGHPAWSIRTISIASRETPRSPSAMTTLAIGHAHSVSPTTATTRPASTGNHVAPSWAALSIQSPITDLGARSNPYPA